VHVPKNSDVKEFIFQHYRHRHTRYEAELNKRKGRLTPYLYAQLKRKYSNEARRLMAEDRLRF
jgi:hypothetical protein